jgi:hypothetical protein
MTEKKRLSAGVVRVPTVGIITKALKEARLEAIEAHRRANLPLVVWKDGQVVLVSPDSIPPLPTSKRRRKTS